MEVSIRDIITTDYRVRGFTRDVTGKKLFMDHKIKSIQDYINEKTLQKYHAMDMNFSHSNIFHTRLLIKDLDLQNYLFNTNLSALLPEERRMITNNLRKEMIEIFKGTNIYNE